MVDYLETFKSTISTLSGYYAEVNVYLGSLSGALEDVKVNTSGQWEYAVLNTGMV
jgi:hypothetical protein